MSDSLKRYIAILNALKQQCPQPPQGNYLRHLHTLAALMGGIVGSRKTNLSHVADKMAGGAQRQSKIKRLSRWLKTGRRPLASEHISEDDVHAHQKRSSSPLLGNYSLAYRRGRWF